MGEGGILKQLTKALVERCLSTEMATYLEEQRTQIQAEPPIVRSAPQWSQ